MKKITARNFPKEYQSWLGMRHRCYNPERDMYSNYGGRGIKVCDRWLASFAFFLEDMGQVPKGYSIDRIDVDGDYEPSNCRWASTYTQSRNKSNNNYVEYRGLNLCVTDWFKDVFGLKSITYRKGGNTPEERAYNSIVHLDNTYPEDVDRYKKGLPVSDKKPKHYITYKGVSLIRSDWAKLYGKLELRSRRKTKEAQLEHMLSILTRWDNENPGVINTLRNYKVGHTINHTL